MKKIKCWKKIKEGNYVRGINKNIDRAKGKIPKNSREIHVSKLFGTSGYLFTVEKPGRLLILRDFRKKSEALKSAHSYMRKNDKC